MKTDRFSLEPVRTLTVVLGLPGAGKSSFVDGLALAGFESNVEEGFVAERTMLVRYDSLRKAMCGQPYFAPAELAVHAVACFMARAALLDGYDVLVDESITRVQHMKDFAAIAHAFGARLHVAHIATLAEVCWQNRVPQGFPEKDFIRKVDEWVDDGIALLALADTVATFVPVDGTCGKAFELVGR